MSLPPGYGWRPAAWGDLDAVVSLFKACDVADLGVEDPVREHLEEAWRRAGRDLSRTAVVVEAADDLIVAYGEVEGVNRELSLDAFVRVHPGHRGRGLGSWALAWAERTAREVASPGTGVVLRNSVPSTDRSAHELVEGHGFRLVRTFWHMERRLDGENPDPPQPPGIAISDYRHGPDADPRDDALEDAFRDHWGWEPYPRDLHMRELAAADPGLVGVAREGVEVVGVCTSRLVEGTGWVDVVGVRRPWRGRGIGRALLLRSFAALARRGAGAVMLNVDSASLSGATRLYESVGMRVHRAWQVYEKPLAG